MFRIAILTGASSAALIFLSAYAARVFVNRFIAACNEELKKKESFYKDLLARFKNINTERNRLDREVTDLSRLYDISKRMSQSLRFEDIFSNLSQFIKENFSVSKVSLTLLDYKKDGIEKQLNTLSNLGLLSRFVGMLTDSRSFLSYSRHEYFRRILCNILGNEVEAGLLPNDLHLLGKMVEDICFNNAKEYFPMAID